MQTIRIRFEKTGRARFISHLDLLRAMTRALRRAAVPLWYTEGFNRHPYVTFAAPLSLGYEGLREAMDIKLEGALSMDELTARLDAVMPEGLHITGAAEAVMKPGDLEAAAWRLTFDCPINEIAEMLLMDSIIVQKKTKKGTYKEVELKPWLIPAKITANGSGAVMELTLPCSGDNTVNPGLIGEAVAAYAGTPVAMAAVRIELLGKNGETFK